MANAISGVFAKGDTIAIDMPMTVDSVIIYLAIIFAGCIVVSIADSFVAKEIATRLKISKAKGIFTQVCDIALTHISSPSICPLPFSFLIAVFRIIYSEEVGVFLYTGDKRAATSMAKFCNLMNNTETFFVFM